MNSLSFRMDHYSLITRRPKEGVPSSRVWTYIYQNQAGAVLATLGIFPGSPRYSGRSASTTQNTQGYQTGADCFCTLRVPATQNPWGNSYNMVLDGWMPLTMGLLLKLDTQSHTWVLHSRLWHIKAWLSHVVLISAKLCLKLYTLMSYWLDSWIVKCLQHTLIVNWVDTSCKPCNEKHDVYYKENIRCTHE